MVSIITVNYNGWKDTCELITSLKQFEDYPYEVIVVDNASNGDDVERISAAHPNVVLVKSDNNLGFAGGNNLGVRYAKGDYFFFLNNDMILKTPVLQRMVDRLSDNKIAGVSPTISYLYKPELVQYYGYKDMSSITLKHTTESYDPLCRDRFLYSHETDVLHGGAMMVRRDVIEKIGLMTEIYFLFYEEFDWCRRMREAGYVLYYEALSEVFHKGSMSIPKETPLREYYLCRARMLYARRNCKGWYKLLACSYQFLFALPKKTLLYFRKGRWDLLKAIWKGGFNGLYMPINS